MEPFFGTILGVLRFLFKPIIDFITKLLFLKAYVISTLYRKYKDTRAHHFGNLTDDIKYQIIWEKHYIGKKLRTPLLLVKTQEGKLFRKAVFVVKASLKNYSYQNCVTAIDITDKTTEIALTSIPFRDLVIKADSIFQPYEDISIELMELYDEKGELIELPYTPRKCFHPVDNIAAILGWEKGYVYSWGKVYNLEFIESEIKELRIRLIGGLLMQPMWLYNLRAKIFTYNLPVKMIFWSKNLITARQLVQAFNGYLKEWREIEEYNANKKLKDSNTTY